MPGNSRTAATVPSASVSGRADDQQPPDRNQIPFQGTRPDAGGVREQQQRERGLCEDLDRLRSRFERDRPEDVVGHEDPDRHKGERRSHREPVEAGSDEGIRRDQHRDDRRVQSPSVARSRSGPGMERVETGAIVGRIDQRRWLRTASKASTDPAVKAHIVANP